MIRADSHKQEKHYATWMAYMTRGTNETQIPHGMKGKLLSVEAFGWSVCSVNLNELLIDYFNWEQFIRIVVDTKQDY
jgi:hypothetical protein